MRTHKTGIALFCLFLLSGCDFLENPQVKKILSYFPFETTPMGAQKSPTPVPTDSSSKKGFDSPEARVAKRNSEFLSEMVTVVTVKPPSDFPLYGDLLGSLNQGASLEGIYNGLVLSDYYKNLEKVKQTASPKVLKVFAEELSAILTLVNDFPQFVENEGLPQVFIPHPEEGEKTKLNLNPKSIQAKEFQVDAVLAERLEKAFIGYNFYSLKRVLTQETLRFFEAKVASGHEMLALWYARYARFSLRHKMNFGLEPRNRTDEAFHYQWAVSSSIDLINWEIINRAHRILNAIETGSN